MSKFCPNCGKEVDLDANFCINCGYSFINSQSNFKSDSNISADNKEIIKETDEMKPKKNKFVVPIIIISVVIFLTALTIFILSLYTTVPDLYDISAEQAEAVLKEKGFVVRKEYAFNDSTVLADKDTVIPNNVISCKPNYARKGSTITLLISKGNHNTYVKNGTIGWNKPFKKCEFIVPAKMDDEIIISVKFTAAQNIVLKSFGSANIFNNEIPIKMKFYSGELISPFQYKNPALYEAIDEKEPTYDGDDHNLKTGETINAILIIPYTEYDNLPTSIEVNMKYEVNGYQYDSKLDFDMVWETFKKLFS